MKQNISAEDICLFFRRLFRNERLLSSSRMMIEQHTAGVYISHFAAVAYEVRWAYVIPEVR